MVWYKYFVLESPIIFKLLFYYVLGFHRQEGNYQVLQKTMHPLPHPDQVQSVVKACLGYVKVTVSN